ncbi:hypothetical protein IPL68_04665 [Candidatus Saccharibacteria bacterium]|nr:MAG: hypothetical protein IPL68_04665 [Candidatus Saccharibacteria bacterium]
MPEQATHSPGTLQQPPSGVSALGVDEFAPVDPTLVAEFAAGNEFVRAEQAPTHHPAEVAAWRDMHITPGDRLADLEELEAVKPGSTVKLPPDVASMAAGIIHDARGLIQIAEVVQPTGVSGHDPVAPNKGPKGGNKIRTNFTREPLALAGEFSTFQPKNGFEKTLATTVERNRPQIERAIELLPYEPTREVIESVAGYYNDHDILLRTVTGYSAGYSTSPVDGEKIISHPILAKAMTDFCSFGQQGRTAEADEFAKDILDSLYDECAIGAQTLPDELIRLKAGIIEKTYQSLGFTVEPGSVERRIIDTRTEALGEVRHAGQPLFHNTPHIREIVQGGFGIMGRTAQTENVGHTYANTGGYERTGPAHANVPHFSEMYDPTSYRRPMGPRSKNERKDDFVGGCVVIPLADVISEAPFGRNIRYGVLSVKPGEVIDAANKTDSIVYDGGNNMGATDRPCAHLSFDRVFFAGDGNNGEGAVPAHNYTLGAAIVHPSRRGTTGDTAGIIITADYDVSPAYSRGPDGELVEDRSGPNFGSGYGFPRFVRIETPDVKTADFRASSVRAAPKKLAELSRPTIEQVAKESIENPLYDGKYVVPLRGAIISFTHEGTLHGKNDATPLQRRYL